MSLRGGKLLISLDVLRYMGSRFFQKYEIVVIIYNIYYNKIPLRYCESCVNDR